MREQDRFYRKRPVVNGPSFIKKEIMKWDTFEDYFRAYWNGKYAETLHRGSWNAFTRPDPLGITGFSVPYSLNKKERWNLPNEFVVEFEKMQSPYLSLRVSMSIHHVSQAIKKNVPLQGAYNIYYQPPSIEQHPAVAYYDVHRDGMARIALARGKRTRLQSLIMPEGLPQRSKGERRMKRKESWYTGHHESACPFDPSTPFQKAHIRYSVMQIEHPTQSSYNSGHRIRRAVDIFRATHCSRVLLSSEELLFQLEGASTLLHDLDLDYENQSILEEEEKRCTNLLDSTPSPRPLQIWDCIVGPTQKKGKKRRRKTITVDDDDDSWDVVDGDSLDVLSLEDH